MAQAGIALAKIPLASPQPTAPPHPRDLARQLYQRQVTAETCGWVDEQFDQPHACAPGAVCASDPALFAAFCCDSASFPTSCFYATNCFDSTAAAGSCPGPCSEDPANLLCTSAGAEYCLTQVFDYSAQENYLYSFSCTDTPATITIFDSYSGAASSSYLGVTVAAGSGPFLATVVSSSTLSPSSSGSQSTSALQGPTTTSTTPLGPVTTTPTAVPASSPKSGLSGGAIAGIVVGIIFLIVLALGMILLYRYFKGRKPPPPPPRQLTHDTTTLSDSKATVQPGSPTLSNPPSNFTMPSNAPLYSPAMNELSPDESKVGSYPTSHSAVGAPPQFSVQHDWQPPASPRTEFGSMTPVNAPDMNPEYTFVPKEPQQ